MDVLDALRLQLEWGADEALLEAAQNRFAVATPVQEAPRAPAPRSPRPISAALPAGPADAKRLAEACATLVELRAALAGFSGCGLRDTATNLVFGEGPEDARLMVIGDAPGADEDRSGRPFCGPPGMLLDKMLASAGFNRAELRVATLLPWRPPGDRDPTESEIAMCLPFLRRQVALVRPACVLLLGGTAAKALLPGYLGKAGIRKLRGQWQRLSVPGVQRSIDCLPTFHPAYLLRSPSAKREAWHDLIALRQWSLTPATGVDHKKSERKDERNP
jgi:DNA polymerase